MRRLAIPLFLAALMVAPRSAEAQELGRIVARIGDAEKRWHTITMQRGSGIAASAGMRFGPRLTELQIHGYPGDRFTSEDAFSVDLRYLGRFGPQAEPMSVDILHMPGGMGGPFWTSKGAPVAPTLRVLGLDVWGAFGRVDLLFAGELCFQRIISASTDRRRCREVTGRIQTELFVEYGTP